jgi:hypothetical protein
MADGAKATKAPTRKAATRRANTRRVRGAPPPPTGAGVNAGVTPPNVASTLRSDASQTIKDHEARWSQFRTDGGDVLDTYFNQTFNYLQGILGPSSSPTDWVKDGLALLIGYCGAGRKIYQAASKLLPSQG